MSEKLTRNGLDYAAKRNMVPHHSAFRLKVQLDVTGHVDFFRERSTIKSGPRSSALTAVRSEDGTDDDS